MPAVAHLVGRFFGSLRPGGPPQADVVWVESLLSPDELELWRAMSGPDRRHSVDVARRVEVALGHEATTAVLAAALLHDVGKTVSGLRTYGRVIATVSGVFGGHEMAHHWSEKRGFTRKVGLYLMHDELGADRLQIAGSDPLTIAWAREHHWPEEMWTLPPKLAHALKAADDD
jgi:hypothetical protein